MTHTERERENERGEEMLTAAGSGSLLSALHIHSAP